MFDNMSQFLYNQNNLIDTTKEVKMQNIDIQKFLDNNEKIIKTLHPQKQRFYFDFFIKTFLWTLWLFCITQLVLLCFNISGAYYLMPLCLFVISFGWAIPSSILKYKKSIYVFTDRRVIYCTGIIKIEIVSMEYKIILGINYRQGYFDKILGNTATLILTKTNTSNENIPQDLQLCFVENGITEYQFLHEITQNKIEKNNIAN